MTDLVYILGAGSRWQDNEIRYSLRSMVKNMKDIGQVFVVGKCPDFLQNVIHIPAENTGNSKEHSIAIKIGIACRDERVSENFLMCNDDHFIMKGYSACEFPYYFDNHLSELYVKSDKQSAYGHAIKDTIIHLTQAGFNTVNFDTHCPIIYNKGKFLNSMKCNWINLGGYLLKSMYCNKMYKGLKLQIADIKIEGHYPAFRYEEMIQRRPWFSTGSRLNYDEFEIMMAKYFPDKSIYEK